MREWASRGDRPFFVLSHRLGPVAESRLAGCASSEGGELVVVYGSTSLDSDWQSKVEGKVKGVGGIMVHRPEVHAKVLVCDRAVCISSYNFLSADPFGTSRRARELGVVLKGGGVADWVTRRLRGVLEEENAGGDDGASKSGVRKT